jgi:hypothetical protein
METIILYFMDPNHKWAGFVAMAAFIILLTLTLLTLDYLGKVRIRNNYARAIPASAKIIKMGRWFDNGTYGGRIVNITLEVIPTDAAPYQVKNIWCLEALALPKVKPGDTIAVRIDPKHPQEIFSAETWAWNLGRQLPLRFGNHIPFLYIDR